MLWLSLRCLAALILTFVSLDAHAQTFAKVDISWLQFRPGPAPYAGTDFMQGLPEEGKKTATNGILKAQIAWQPAKAPLAILQHGCGGLYNDSTQSWVKSWTSFFWQHGYSVLVLDSFTSRNVANTCGDADYPWSYRRRDDAYSALSYVVESGRADVDNVVLLGASAGGRSVLRVFDDKMNYIRPYRFKAGYAMYPNCREDSLRKTNFYAPVYIFIGDTDDPNPAKHCELLKSLGTRNVNLTVYAGHVYHGFDTDTKSHLSFGWRMGGDREATAKAKAAIAATLSR